LFAPVNASPSIHSDEAAHEGQVAQIEDCGIANVRETAEMAIAEWPGYSLVEVLYTVDREDLSFLR